MDDRLGRVVSSIAGRDKKNLFIVIDVIGEYLLLVDGCKRKLDKPKKKKLKHVKFTNICLEDIRTKIEKHDKITNAELRRSLKAIDIVDLT